MWNGHTHTHTHTHTMEYYSTIEKNEIIGSNMDGPRDYHTKWSKSDRYILYITYMCKLKKIVQMNLFIKRETN